MNSQIASIQFDAATGWLAIAGNANNNIVKQTVTGNGYYQFDIDGTIFSSDRSSVSFWESLDGATSASVIGINFDGGLGDDALIVGNQDHSQSFGVIADDAIQIQGELNSQSIFFKAKDIINQGSIIASNITAEFSNSYSDVADAKIIAIDGGSILLNGGKTGDLEATGQFLATGLTGGKIDFRGKTVTLRGADLDASGKNGGGAILVGGDYQGVDPTGIGNLSNARFNFVDEFSSINANAITRGNGGKVIIWSDVDTDFQGNITARGGLRSGDGGFVEVSGKQILNFVGNVDVDAAKGKQGSILLDPTDLIIGPDDGNDETFDISDLVKAGGHLLLDATNDIIFNTEVNFLTIPFDALPTEENAGTISPSSLTLIAGNSVIFREDINTFGRDLKITASFIKADGRIRTNDSLSPTGGGYIELVSRGGIDIKDISTSNGFSQGSSINLEAGTFITAGRIDTSGFSGGDVRLSAKEDVTSSDIVTYSTNGSSGNVNIKASIGAKLGSIYTYSNGDIGKGGAVTINSEYIFMNGIGSSANGGLGGKVTLNSNQDIILRSYISSGSVGGNAGAIRLVSASGSISGQGLSANSKQGNGANISLTANRLITTGLIDAGADGNGNGGNIRLSALSDILTSTIVTNSNGNGKSGNISLVSSNGNIKTTNDSPATSARLLYAGAVGGNAGSVTLKAFGDIESGSITTSSQYGAGGNVKIEAGGDILTGAIASNTFAGSGKGGNISLISDRGNIQIDYARSDSAGGKSGNISLDANKKFVKVTGAINIEARPTSVYSGDYQKGSIIIKHGGGSQLVPFIVGDSSVNGTFAEIQGKEGLSTKSILPESFSWKRISIITDSSPLADALASSNNTFSPLSSASNVVVYPSSIPPGVSIDDNIRTAIDNRFTISLIAPLIGAPIWNPLWFYDKVKNRGDWDYKQLNQAYQNFGNFNYGATGKAFGFPEHTLLQEAGIAQIKAGTSRPEWGNPGTRGNPFDPGTPPYGDDPDDQYWIKEGIKYYDEVYARKGDAFYRQFEVFPTDYNFRLF